MNNGKPNEEERIKYIGETARKNIMDFLSALDSQYPIYEIREKSIRKEEYVPRIYRRSRLYGRVYKKREI